MGGNQSGRRMNCSVSGRGGCPRLAPIRQSWQFPIFRFNAGVGYTLMSHSTATHP